MCLVPIDADGRVDSEPITAGLFQIFSAFWKLDDLEGLALDRAGFVFATTSHSRNDGGEEKAAREKLVRFRIKGNRVVDPKVVGGLKRTITAQQGLERAEGVSLVLIGGVQRIIIFSDDGDRQAGRFANYLLLDPGQPQTAH